MNTLSVLIYLADILPRISTSIGVLSTLAGFSLLITAAYNSGEYKNHKYWKYLSIPCFFLLVVAFIPSKGTVYAIAASELGEQAVKSEIGVKTQKAVSLWIDYQIEELNKKTKPQPKTN